MNNFLKDIDRINEYLTNHIENFETTKEMQFARMLKLVEEVGELSEQVLGSAGHQRKEKSDKISKEHLGGEIMDVLITAFLVGKAFDIDMEKHWKEKVEKIKQRAEQRSK